LLDHAAIPTPFNERVSSRHPKHFFVSHAFASIYLVGPDTNVNSAWNTGENVLLERLDFEDASTPSHPVIRQGVLFANKTPKAFSIADGGDWQADLFTNQLPMFDHFWKLIAGWRADKFVPARLSL
jgi:hypothetical protein